MTFGGHFFSFGRGISAASSDAVKPMNSLVDQGPSKIGGGIFGELLWVQRNSGFEHSVLFITISVSACSLADLAEFNRHTIFRVIGCAVEIGNLLDRRALFI